MKVVVTGNLGFMGSHLTDKLVENGHTVLGIDDLSGGNMKNFNPKMKAQYQIDLRDAEIVDGVFKKFKPEIVFHLAANAAENKAQFSPIDITSRNYSAFINTLTPFIKYGGNRFVFTSSIAVYGALQTPFKETDKPEPEDLYGITKLAAEQTLKVMSKVHGFEYVIARPHNVYGKRQNMSDPYRNVVTIWMNAILKGEPIYIYGDGEQKRQFSYIYDVILQLYKCGFNDVANMTFNLGTSIGKTVNELFEEVKHVTGYTKDPIYLPERPQEVKEALADHTLCDKELGMAFYSSHKYQGLEATFKWAQEQGPQELKYTEIEIESEKIPSNWKKI